ncbi:MAG: hypothetical protein ABI760_22570 [Ferruginibacter sp.]
MSKKKLPLHLMMIRGSLGKQFCIKHYKWGIIMTKFPDMTKIKASAGQRSCRNLFREAVAYAKSVIADKEKKKEWQKRLRRRNGVYNEAVKFYMLKDKLAKQREEMLTRQLISNALKHQQPASQNMVDKPPVERQPPKVITMQDISSERDKRFATVGGLRYVTEGYLLSG